MDPTKKDAGLNLPKRAVGAIFIAYDPNNGDMNIKSDGLLPIEEIGAIQWALNIRMREHLHAIEESKKGQIVQ